MNKLCLIMGVVILVIASILTGCTSAGITLTSAPIAPSATPTQASTPSPSATKPETTTAALPSKVAVTLKYDFWLSNKVAMYPVVEKYFKGLEAATGGTVKVDLYPGSTMGKETECYQRTITGVANIGHFAPGMIPGIFTGSDLFEFPVHFPTGKFLAEAQYQMWQKGYFDKEYSGVKLMAIQNNGPWVLYTNKRVTTVADFKGMKIRCSSDSWVDVTKALGAIPVTGIATAESYMALQKGIIDGNWMPYSGASVYKLNEVSKYVLEVMFGTLVHSMCMNLDTWNALPDAAKQYIEAQRHDFTVNYSEESVNIPAMRKLFTETKGDEVLTLSTEETNKMNELFAPIWSNWAKKVEAKGYPGNAAIKDLNDMLTKQGVPQPLGGYTGK